METTLTNRVNIAKAITAETASLKDWKIRNSHNRKMREIARDLTSGKGYIIATARELKAKYGDLCHYQADASDSDRKRIWSLGMNGIYNKILFTSI